MAIITDSWFYDLIGISTALLAILIAYLKWSFTYWEKRGLKTPPPRLPFGTATDLLLQRISFSADFKNIYDVYKKKGLRHCGYYILGKPIYVALDVDIVKHIMQKDFQHFVNHGAYFNEKDDPLSAHLFNLEDTKWKKLREKLTPTFTSGKLKMMFQTLVDCSKELGVIMDESSKGKAVDIKDILARFTTDIIGSVAFGIDCNTLKNPDAEFRKNGRRVFEVTAIEVIKQFILITFPRKFLNFFGFKQVNSDVSKFFMNVIRETVEYREKNNIHRKDFMHLLLQLKNRGAVSDNDSITSDGVGKGAITMNELSAQAFVFFLAGFETSSTTMTFALYELAINPDVQDKLRSEINKVLAKHDNQITYDALMEMEYMDQVINETLRKYPPLPVLSRECNKDYVVPGTDLVLEHGISVFIPVLGIHYDPEYYPEPEKFIPERFNEENKNNRPAFTHLPFGEGPRICIGLRFGIMQSKVGLTALLQNYKVSLNSKTKTPLFMDPLSFITTVKGGVWLNVEKI